MPDPAQIVDVLPRVLESMAIAAIVTDPMTHVLLALLVFEMRPGHALSSAAFSEIGLSNPVSSPMSVSCERGGAP